MRNAEGWHPIATAPKDGTEVYLWADAWEMTWGTQVGHFADGRWHTEEGAVDENEPGFDPDAEVGDDYDPDSDKNMGPTHWLLFKKPSGPR